MTVQKLLTYGGLKKQTAKGSVATTPATFGLGLKGGQILTTPITSDYEDITLPGGASDRFAPAIHRTQIIPGAAFTADVRPRSIALWLIAALGGVVTTGAGPYTHTITPALALPYLGLFGQYGELPERTRLNDAKVDTLALSWAETEPPELEIGLIGCSVTPDVASFTATNDETVRDKFTPLGGTFQLDVDGASPADEPVTGASFQVSNNVEPVMLSKQIFPDDVKEGEQTIEGTLSLKPADLDEWQNILTGTAGGTTLRTTTLYGSILLKLAIDANTELTFTANRVEFIADFPESDPGGGSSELELAWRVVRPTDASAAFTAVAKNDIVSY